MKNILIHGLLVSCVLISVAASAGIKKYFVDGKNSPILMRVGEASMVLDVELVETSLSADELLKKGASFTGETTAKILKVYKGDHKEGGNLKFVADNFASKRWSKGLKTIVFLDEESRAFSTIWNGALGYEEFKTTFDQLSGKLKKLDEPVFQAIRDARKRVAKYCANPPKDVSPRSCKYYLESW